MDVRGATVLTVTDSNDNAQRDAGSTSAKAAPAKPRRRTRSSGEDQVGKALRSVFEETVGETIPREMLDLLGKLS